MMNLKENRTPEDGGRTTQPAGHLPRVTGGTIFNTLPFPLGCDVEGRPGPRCLAASRAALGEGAPSPWAESRERNPRRQNPAASLPHGAAARAESRVLRPQQKDEQALVGLLLGKKSDWGGGCQALEALVPSANRS